MCPLFSTLVFFLLFIGPTFLLCSAASWTVQFTPNIIELHMSTTETVNLTIDGLNYDEITNKRSALYVRSDKDTVLGIDKQIRYTEISPQGQWIGSFDVEAIFLGNANAYVELVNSDGSTEQADKVLPVVIIRENRFIDHAFTGSVATLVAILYINFGAALDLEKLKGIVIRPIGPAIGFVGQFVIMPLLSYGLGLLIFPNNVEMQLGMFFTGVSPAGGASNIWTVILGGNVDLSITMTTISTLAAFGMMPIWLFTLGRVIFDRGNLTVPYQNLSTYVIALIIPLGIGMLIRRFLPRIGRFLVRILKPVSALLIIFIVVFAIVTNLYLFQLFSWQIVVAGLCLPWISYILGGSLAKLLKQSTPDALAIALETGIQNTGIAIFILRFSLGQPQADLTTIVPVSVSIMTPLPLICLFIYQQIRHWMGRRKAKSELPLDNDMAYNDTLKDPVIITKCNDLKNP